MRARLTAVLLIPLVLLYLFLGFAYGHSDADSMQWEVYLDRLGDAGQLAMNARQALGSDDPVTLRSEFQRYHDVHGVGALLVDPSGDVVVSNRLRLSDLGGNGEDKLDAALSGRSGGAPTSLRMFDDYLVVAEPIFESGDLVGAVVTASDSDELAADVLQRWAVLATIGLAALAASTIVVSRLAQWVLNPLQDVATAMTEMLHGHMDARISSTGGPRELQQLMTVFNGMASEVEQLIGQQQEFVSNAAHELRNPLNALLLRVEHLGLGLGPEWQEEIDLTREEGQRIAKILDALLVLSSGGGTTNLRPVNIAELIQRRVVAWQSMAGEQRKSIRTGMSKDLWCQVDEIMLESAVDAVIDNALKFSPEDTTVSVDLYNDAGYVTIVVHDQGPGMSEAQISRATSRFWRSGEHQNVQGSGLGLAIATEFVASCGGELDIERAEGGGLVVSMRMPTLTSEHAQLRDHGQAVQRRQLQTGGA